MEGQKKLMVSYLQALSTAGSSRKSWQGQRKEQLIKLSSGLIRQAVGSDSRGKRLNCRRIRARRRAKTNQGQLEVWVKGKLIGQHSDQLAVTAHQTVKEANDSSGRAEGIELLKESRSLKAEKLIKADRSSEKPAWSI